ncbi:30S ribosomal protein S6 [Rhodohalobacter sp. SW132]|uniref:30S ribosomal protein S6 n=1 Tax=Rhodohalobacter sp. SW132 TaxID=2293433 RepID=UPI000E27C892|nr:30S ribosomal protein S6 [Rhodohalobacter sp. SW132]REL33579.1 30S ribosomal protein S6 [Rhodohalobacter sp. SW132]
MKKEFYEMTYILNPVLDDEKFKELVDHVQKLIEDNGGDVVDTDEWGVKQLAYPIEKKNSGYYVNLYFNAPKTAIEPVERNMRIHDDIMRYLTLKYDAKMKRHYDLKKKGDLPVIFEDLEEEENTDDN